jgi:hypothetical protein
MPSTILSEHPRTIYKEVSVNRNVPDKNRLYREGRKPKDNDQQSRKPKKLMDLART